MVPAGIAMHWRRGARDVADWRRGNKPRDPGRGRGANILAERLARGTATTVDLERVQLRRRFPTRMTQGMQVFCAEPGDRQSARRQSNQIAVAAPTFQSLAVPAAHPGPCDRHRLSRRAREDTGVGSER